MVVDGVILAAGLSSRIKPYKMALKVADKTVIEDCIEPMYDFCSQIIVVVGYKHNIVEELLKGYSKVKLVFNADYLKGMFSSVKAGIREVRSEGFFLIPGDYSLIKKSTYEKMLKAKGDILIPTYRGEKGHPVLISSKYIEEILNNSNYESLRALIKQHKAEIIEVEDQGILLDIDTQEDYEKVLRINKLQTLNRGIV